MLSQSDALNLIRDSLDSLERSGSLEQKIHVQEQTVLLGSGSSLDSLGFVTFITDLEDRLQQETQQEHYLVLTEISQFNINSPSLTVGALANYIVQLTRGNS